MDISLHPADSDDVALLARLNQQLIEDERSRNPMSRDQLEDRMRGWLDSDWQAVLIQGDGQCVGYALYQTRVDEYQSDQPMVYVRQYFIVPEHRRQGIGARAFELIAREYFPAGVRITLDVLEINPVARHFWKSLGFKMYCVTLHRSSQLLRT